MQREAEPAELPHEDSERDCPEEQMTRLNYEFCFWFSYFKEQRHKQAEDYENNIKKIGSFKTAEEFWGYYQHIRRPDSLPKCCEFLLFKAGVRPVWEDPANRGGGRFVLHIKRMFANKTWEDIIIAFIITTKDHDHLNGVVINVRSWEVLLSIWMKQIPTDELKEKYRSWIRQSLAMSENVKIEYKEHPNPEEMKVKPPVQPVQEEDSKRDENEKPPAHLRDAKEPAALPVSDQKDEEFVAESKHPQPKQDSD